MRWDDMSYTRVIYIRVQIASAVNYIKYNILWIGTRDSALIPRGAIKTRYPRQNTRNAALIPRGAICYGKSVCPYYDRAYPANATHSPWRRLGQSNIIFAFFPIPVALHAAKSDGCTINEIQWFDWKRLTYLYSLVQGPFFRWRSTSFFSWALSYVTWYLVQAAYLYTRDK
jgi:hypothetical protein